jgi:hypothetical protein
MPLLSQVEHLRCPCQLHERGNGVGRRRGPLVAGKAHPDPPVRAADPTRVRSAPSCRAPVSAGGLRESTPCTALNRIRIPVECLTPGGECVHVDRVRVISASPARLQPWQRQIGRAGGSAGPPEGGRQTARSPACARWSFGLHDPPRTPAPLVVSRPERGGVGDPEGPKVDGPQGKSEARFRADAVSTSEITRPTRSVDAAGLDPQMPRPADRYLGLTLESPDVEPASAPASGVGHDTRHGRAPPGARGLATDPNSRTAGARGSSQSVRVAVTSS